MAVTVKPGVYTLVKFIKEICRFSKKHSGTFIPVLTTTLDPDSLAKVVAALTAINIACDVFNLAFPDIKP